MNQRFVDVAVVGAGSAGLRAYRAAKQWTDNVVLIESGRHGTTCARVGCMPSKLLIAAADAAHGVGKAREFGIHTGSIRVHGEAVMDRVRTERDRFVGFVVDGVERIPEVDRLSGHARFLNDHQLDVGGDTIVSADRIVIATGSAPIYPKFLEQAGNRLVVNEDIFEWRDLPQSVAVFGAGVVGLEIGQALSRLGVDVTMFGLGGLIGPLSDPVVKAAAGKVFSREFYLDTEAKVERVQRFADGVEIDFLATDGQLRTIHVDYVIAATGRAPNVSRLGLENTSLPLDVLGVPRFDPATMRAGQSSIFIAGDVNNDRPLLHEAADEGEIAGTNAGRYPDVHPGLRRTPLGIVFSDPQIAMVGDRFDALADQDIVIGEVSFEDQGRSRVMLVNQGLMRLYADSESGRFLGAEMIGPRAEHIAHLLAWARQSGMTVSQMLDMPFYHPVVEEGLRTALREASEKLSIHMRRAA